MRRALSLLLFLLLPVSALADRAADLRAAIALRNAQIAELEAEIAKQQTTLNSNLEQGRTLQGEIKNLDASAKKLDTKIKLTDQKIAEAKLVIEQLGLDISDKQASVTKQQAALGEALRLQQEMTGESLPEILLGYPSLGNFWNETEKLFAWQGRVQSATKELRHLTGVLRIQKTTEEAERQKLLALESQLDDEKKIVADNKATKDTLLKATKSQESLYRQQLSQLEAKRAAFASELFNFESQLRAEIDPNSLPASGSHALLWPLDKIKITQGFGKTVAAKQLYASGTHNGIDLAASVGTPVKAAAGGVVMGTGDTDPICRGVSYGKWVLIKHQNGLTTVYGHLSLIKVSEGQSVATGQLIAYSGKSGYATGPHLHLSVFASNGVKVGNLPSGGKVCLGVTFRIPLAPANAYLDPLLYL